MTDRDARLSCSPDRLSTRSHSSLSSDAVGKPLALRLGVVQAEDSSDRSQPQTATVDDDNPPDDPRDERTSNGDLNDDDDSTFGEDNISTISLPVEADLLVINGRKHSSMVQGVHPWMPNDKDQCDMMDIRHHVAINLFDGVLYQAPLMENIQDVLDVGTGTGLWAIEFADNHPHTFVIGTDLFPIQPNWVPTNLQFEVDDCTPEWARKEKSFDYVHVRQLTGSISDWTSLFGEAFKCLKPEGFLESHEQSLRIYHHGVPLFDPASERLMRAITTWNSVFEEAGRQSGCSFVVADGDTQMESMKAAGFTNLKEYRIANWQIPIGGWAKDRNLKETGKYLQAALLGDLDGLLNYPAKILKWRREEITVLLAEVRKALRSEKLLCIKASVVVGQKPG